MAAIPLGVNVDEKSQGLFTLSSISPATLEVPPASIILL